MKYSDDKRRELIKKIFWDYEIDIESLLSHIDNGTLSGGKEQRLFIRCLENLPWHCVVGVFGFDKANELLTDEVIQKVWPEERSDHFATLKKILRGEPLPTTRWDSELRKKLKSTVLSYRWYRTQ